MSQQEKKRGHHLLTNKISFWKRTLTFLAFLLATLVLSYGWHITEINLGEMVRDFHLVKPLIKDLFNPDIISQNKRTLSVETVFHLGGPSVEPPKNFEKSSGDLNLSRSWGSIGEPLAIIGEGIMPNRNGKLYWINSVGQLYPLDDIRTDIQGHFRKEIKVPNIARGEWQTIRATFSWNVSGWHLSQTFLLAFDKMIETIFLALMSTILAIIIAIPLSFLGARNLMMSSPLKRTVYYAVRTFFNFLRSIEPLVLAILFAVWVGIGPFAGVLALGFHSIAALGKLYSEQIESIDQGTVEAISATGAKSLQVIFYAVIPQVIPQFLAFTFYRWDINVRMSTIIGFVGGGGIGFLIKQWISLLQYRKTGTALLLIVIVVISLDLLSAKIREKID